VVKITDENLPKLINVNELKEYLGCSTNMAYKLVKQRNFPSIKIGKRYKIMVEKIPDWLENQSKLKKGL
jgi:excisionase family DNA binding protein